jgi:hypothetical protein
VSGGHWEYLSHKLEERAAYAGNVWKLLAAIEHELDWGICGDTCYECAKIRVPRALEAYFDTGAENETEAIAILRNREPECERCKRFKAAWTTQVEITFELGEETFKGIATKVVN